MTARPRRKRKAHPQLIAIEAILVALFAAAAYLTAAHFSGRSALPVFLAGAAADRALILVLRHANRRLLPRMPRVATQQRRAPARRRA